jgi:Ca2+:H+ antiporter
MKETSPSSDSYIDRIRSWAASNANGRSPHADDTSRSPTLPVTNADTHEKPTSPAQQNAILNGPPTSPPDPNDRNHQVATATANNVADKTSSDHPPPAPPPQTDGEGSVIEPKKSQRKNVAVRFYMTARSIILSSYINILLVVVPVGIAAKVANLKPGIVFGMNAIAIIPLAGLLSHATESVAKRMGDTIGALMNVTFGNAVELIILYVVVASCMSSSTNPRSMYVYLTRDQGKKEREALLKGIIISIESHIVAPVLFPPPCSLPVILQDPCSLFSFPNRAALPSKRFAFNFPCYLAVC